MTPKQAKEFVERVKNIYAKPIAHYYGDEERRCPGCYCVGGAICRMTLPMYKRFLAGWIFGYEAYGAEMTFPTISLLADKLMDLNEKLTEDRANYYAQKIMMRNDSDDFNSAWAYAEGALCYPNSDIFLIDEEDNNYGQTEDRTAETARAIQNLCGKGIC